MSEKNKKLKKEKALENNKKDTVIEKEELSKGEKIFHYVTILIGLIVIMIIFASIIFGGGDKSIIANRFDSLSKDHVFLNIDYDELQEKINNKETFQVLLINNQQEDADYYIYCVDYMMKSVNEELETNEEIFILNPKSLSNDEDDLFIDIDKDILKSPNIINFYHGEDVLPDHSIDGNSSTRYSLDDYSNNYFSLLAKYFNDCYGLDTE